jgi:hypothetical protein
LSLKLQILKEVARLGGVTQEEAEQVLQLRTTPAPGNPPPPSVRRRFQRPSTTEWKLLSRVAAYPRLAAELDLADVDQALEESQLLLEIAARLKGNRDPQPLSNAMMIETFKESPRAGLLYAAQAFGLELGESEEDSKNFVRHTLRKLEIARKKKEIGSLEERLGRGLLSKEEHHRYAQMISEVKILEAKLQADARTLSQGLG